MDYNRIGWDFVIKYERMLRGIARKFARVAGDGAESFADELYSEAVDKAPRVAENWEEYRGSLYAWMRKNLSWYMYKLVLKRKQHADALATAPQDEREYDAAIGSELEAIDEVYFLLQDLDETERTVLVAYETGDMTFEQIAQQLDMSKGTVRLRYHAAVKKARQRHGSVQAGNELAGSSERRSPATMCMSRPQDG